MGKTTRTHKGETHRQMQEVKRHATSTKFMGYTSGQHTKVYDRVLVDGQMTNVLVDRVAVAGEDYIKYGYPNDFRSKKEKQGGLREY